jgi:hypothetical protein
MNNTVDQNMIDITVLEEKLAFDLYTSVILEDDIEYMSDEWCEFTLTAIEEN